MTINKKISPFWYHVFRFYPSMLNNSRLCAFLDFWKSALFLRYSDSFPSVGYRYLDVNKGAVRFYHLIQGVFFKCLHPFYLISQKLLIARWLPLKHCNKTPGHGYILNLSSLGEVCQFMCVFKVDIEFCTCYKYCYKTNTNWLILHAKLSKKCHNFVNS